MRRMHGPDNDSNNGDEAANGAAPKPFTITCDRCGAWTPADEFEDELHCCRCGAPIGQITDIAVNLRPGITPLVRWIGRIALAALALTVLLAIWALVFKSKP